MAKHGRTIAFNAAVSYASSFAALVLGLFTSRWTLQALGASDFGISVTVGALVAFGTFISDIFAVSVARHLSFAAGCGDHDEIASWMRAACTAHFALACAITAVIWPSGEWAVRSFIRIPPDRLGAALVVFRCSLAMLFATTATIPFYALFTAHQRFAVPSAVAALRSLWLFGWGFWLTKSQGDRLVAYAAYSLAGLAAAQTALVVCALAHFGSPKWQLGVNLRKLREIASFAGWNIFGGGGYLIATQGTAFVTNRFFGTVGNAAYGIAQQVQNHAESLANALTGAFAPAVTSTRGSGDKVGMRRLARRAGLLVPLLMAIFVVPLVAEMQTVLEVWLGSPPPCAAGVCAILLIASIFNKLTMGQQLAIAADGRIAKLQVVGGVGQSLALPISIALAATGCGIASAAAAYAIAFSTCFAANLHFGSNVAGLRVRDWARHVAMPFIATAAAASAAATAPRLWMTPGLPRVVVASAMSSAVFAASFAFLLSKWKR